MIFWQRIFHFIKKLFWTGLWITGLFLILCFLLRRLSGDKFFFVRFTNYFMPWLGLLLFIELIIAGCSKKLYLCLLLLLPLILIGQSYLPHFGNCHKAKLSDAPSIKIMSYNVWEFNRDQIAMTEVIKQEKPEILLLQEIKPNWIQNIKNTLSKQYSGSLHVAYEPRIELAVISIYPLKEIEAFTQKNRAQKVVIKTPFGLMTVINIHAYKKNGWKYRHLQMKKLLEDDIVPEKGPLILGGDLNTNEQSQTYKMINKYLENAHCRVGCGYGFTYPARPSFIIAKHYSIFPIIRIDHIFYSNHLILLSARTIYESGGSDHFPIVARFFFKTSF